MSPALSRSSRQRCGQNMRWNNLRFLHETATYLLQLDFKLLTSWLFRNGGCRSDFHFMGTLHIVTTPSEWHLATNTSVWQRLATERTMFILDWLPLTLPLLDQRTYCSTSLDWSFMSSTCYQSDLGPPWVSVRCLGFHYCCLLLEFIFC